ncbi:hypothetical protein DSM112329_00730 [Paraconexibacter sp. AEG42_29]|uniref:Uncharacterized protein n=1 Tax=Paraconexibacter sp. AEG42_29 TaxID=2997339 RepID=A0AAU7AQI6_9ACTN
MSRRVWSIALVTLVAAPAVVAVPALGQAEGEAVYVTFDPPRASQGADYLVRALGARFDPARTKTPSTIRVDTPAGVRLNTKAVAALCSPEQAKALSCPPASKVAKGGVSLETEIIGGYGGTIAPTATVYLTPPTQPGDLAGLTLQAASSESATFTIPGRVIRGANAGAPALLFDLSTTAKLPSGVTAKVKDLSLVMGARRPLRVTVTQTRKVKQTTRVRGKDGKLRKRTRTVTKKVKVRKTVTQNLITTPKTCAGSFMSTVTYGYTDGSVNALPGATPCFKS